MPHREFLHDLTSDVRYAMRALRRTPAFTCVVIGTLAVAIGATTAVFGAVNGLLLRPLPFPDPSRLMRVSLAVPDAPGRKGASNIAWSYPRFQMFSEGQNVFEDLSLYSEAQFTVASGDNAERIGGEWITDRYLPTLGVALVRGRNFTAPTTAQFSIARECIISHMLWQRHYNADSDVVGKSVDVNGDPYVIIGVAPAAFAGLSGQGEIFLPVAALPASQLTAASQQFEMVARVKLGITTAQMHSEVQRLGDLVDNQLRGANSVTSMRAVAHPLNNARVSPVVRRAVGVLFGAVVFVLLIACVNVANLLLARSELRRREIAVRLALGAARGRLVRLLLAESIVLAGAGGAIGVGISAIAIQTLATSDAAAVRLRNVDGGIGIVDMASVRLDPVVLAFAAMMTVLVAGLFGLVPALGATKPSLTTALKSGTGRNRAGENFLQRWSLLITEVALSVVLLAGAGLMIRSVVKLLEIDPGFESRGVLTARIALPGGAVARDSLPKFYAQLRDRIASVPGVSSAALGDQVPLSGLSNTTRVKLMDRAFVDAAVLPSFNISRVTAEWFGTLHVSLKRGRQFTSFDRAGAPSVVVINETASRQFWPNDNPVGKRIALNQRGFDDASGGAEIVGVVADVYSHADSAPRPTAYLPFAQANANRVIIFLRTNGDPKMLVGPLREAVRSVAPSFPLYDVETMDTRLAAATAQARFTSALLGAFATVALALATVGIYGVMNVFVGQRRREIGIRIAIGGSASAVISMIMAHSFRVIAAGIGIGIVGALGLTRMMSAMLFNVAASDPVTYFAIVSAIGISGGLATWLPAHRAAKLDPVQALRSD